MLMIQIWVWRAAGVQILMWIKGNQCGGGLTKTPDDSFLHFYFSETNWTNLGIYSSDPSFILFSEDDNISVCQIVVFSAATNI